MVMESTSAAAPSGAVSMTLVEWLQRQGRGALRRLSRETNIHYDVLWRYREARNVPGYDNAVRIEVATGGVVTAMSLMSGKRRVLAVEKSENLVPERMRKRGRV